MTARELCALAINWLKERYPDAIIVPELSVDDWGGAKLDLGAITGDRIVGVEIKGEGDSARRLPLQGAIYPRVATEMWLLPDQSLMSACLKARPPGWGVLRFDVETQTLSEVEVHSGSQRILNYLCPAALCGTLWREELIQIVKAEELEVKHLRVLDMTRAILENLPVTRIHARTIECLRGRKWRHGKTVHLPASVAPANSGAPHSSAG
ncbi:hypothetical protein AA14337_3131 [Acetobacter malorum DSM 14337]|uniref:Uncharacterized protein n=1 Tax=Acetobacter malorum DSM 14337 TaxID=1307910 RepID=A0ABQ0PZW6_9PROT|nr:hypothetical protein [Acetobacter malorum]KXV05708.1 hypothetical protein AD930_11290 [Acetobacter malorum]GBQ85660.1 hypothetical protein AA14337_3131 [Acetobacter malorum DSM 14337]